MQVLAPAQQVAASKAMMSAQKPMDADGKWAEKKPVQPVRCRSSLGLDVLPNRLDVVTRDDHQTVVISDE